MLCIYEDQIEVKPEALSLSLQDGNAEIKLQPSQQEEMVGEDDTIGLMVGGDRGVVND